MLASFTLLLISADPSLVVYGDRGEIEIKAEADGMVTFYKLSDKMSVFVTGGTTVTSSIPEIESKSQNRKPYVKLDGNKVLMIIPIEYLKPYTHYELSIYTPKRTFKITKTVITHEEGVLPDGR